MNEKPEFKEEVTNDATFIWEIISMYWKVENSLHLIDLNHTFIPEYKLTDSMQMTHVDSI